MEHDEAMERTSPPARRDSGFLQPLVDEEKQFMLLARQHRRSPGIKTKTKPEQSLSVPVVFRNCLNFNESVHGLETMRYRRPALGTRLTPS